MGRVFALLVGIDRYQGPVATLQGCRADVEDVKDFLSETGRDSTKVEILCDESATRAAVIGAFGRHLGQAKAGDTALFWFSGHGSTAPVPSWWWHLEPSGQLQTLVCADSRTNGVPDLLDKELAVLIAQIATGGAHVVVTLDCCHAEGGTRAGRSAGRARSAPPQEIPGPETVMPEVRSAARGLQSAALKGAVDHVALAACRSDQSAYETMVHGKHRGAFTVALLSQLRRVGATPTYRELLVAARCQVENQYGVQSPVLYPAHESIVDQPFLGGLVRPSTPTMTMRYFDGAWEIDAGRCHGLTPGDAGADDGGTWIAVENGMPLREARLSEVRAERSVVEPMGWDPEPDRQYRVVLARVPLPPTSVLVETGPDHAEAAERLSAAVASAGPGGRPSPHVRLLDPQQQDRTPELVVAAAEPGSFGILRADGRVLSDPVPDSDGRGPSRVVDRLEHIARWQRIKELANPLSRLSAAVRVEIVPAQPGEQTAPQDRSGLAPGADGRIEMAYTLNAASGAPASDWAPPTVFVRLRNTHSRRLFCVLLDLTDRFRIHADLFTGAFVGAGQTGAAAEGLPVTLTLPRDRPIRPGASVEDWLMLIVAEDEINSRLFTMPPLGAAAATPRAPIGVTSLVERLGLAALDRDVTPSTATTGDWWTTLIPIVTRVPGPDAPAGE